MQGPIPKPTKRLPGVAEKWKRWAKLHNFATVEAMLLFWGPTIAAQVLDVHPNTVRMKMRALGIAPQKVGAGKLIPAQTRRAVKAAWKAAHDAYKDGVGPKPSMYRLAERFKIGQKSVWRILRERKGYSPTRQLRKGGGHLHESKVRSGT